MLQRVPCLTVHWNFSKKVQGCSIKGGVFPSVTHGQIQFGQQCFSHIIASFETAARIVVVLGSPLKNGRVNRRLVAKSLAKKFESIDDIKKLNGEFLIFIFEKEEEKLTVFTDRFASYPFYWAKRDGEFVGSYNYLDVAKKCKSWPGFSLRIEKAYEFFLLQRLMGTETHDSLTQFLPAGSALELKKYGVVNIIPYWSRFSSVKTHNSSKNVKDKFIELFKASVQQRLSKEAEDSELFVFLSGGHDSRLVSAYSNEKVTALTLSFTDNQEVSCARRVAAALGQRHIFEKLDGHFFEKTLNATGYLSGGMYAIDHALFFDSSENNRDKPIFLHGHGLDYMFQGMYLNAKKIKLFGRSTYLKSLQNLPADITLHFIKNISFRLKHDYSKYFRIGSDITNQCETDLYRTVKSIENEALSFGLTQHQIWEHLIFHQPSRHYTFSNVLSKRSRGEVRTPTFDNVLFDFYLSLRPKDRINASLMNHAMKSRGSSISKIPAGNHGMPAGIGPWKKTFLLIVRKFLKEATGLKRFSVPSDADRTWPDRDVYVKSHPAYLEKMLEPLDDTAFKNILPFIDWEKLKVNSTQIFDEPGGASFMVTLLTYYSFYKFLYEKK